MYLFWIASGLLVFIALGVIWHHFMRKPALSKPQTMQADAQEHRVQQNLQLYKEQLAQLEQELSEQQIEQQHFDELKIELERTLLQDLEGSENTVGVTDRPTLGWPLAISLFIVSFSALLYSQVGALPLIGGSSEQSAAQAHQNSEAQQLISELQRLQDKVQAQPEDSQAWFAMGEILVQIGEYDNALIAIDRTLAIEGEHADILAAKAQALYYKQGQQMTAEVKALTDRALALDPLDSSTRVLLGMDAFMNNQFADAVAHWQKVVSAARGDVNIDALNDVIREAQSKLALLPEKPPTASGASLSLNISLSSEIQRSLGEDKTVYVYATPASGARMPVAVVKLMASDLPTSVVLSDAQAMSAEASLSATPVVNLYAVLSQNGQPGMQPGDFRDMKTSVKHDHNGVIELVIGERVN
jgi:cytochrome c-type biogenesis protein CcmH